MHKNILITGGAKRVGAQSVRFLHAQGANILLHYRSSVTEAVVDIANQAWGGIDVLINNASAFYATEMGSVSENDWDDLFASNVNFPVYSIAKAALVALTKVLAKELAPEIRVNAVAPGAILWPESEAVSAQEKQEIQAKVALQRTGHPEDIAKAIYFLIEEATYMTGQVLTIDGGRTLFS